MFDIVVCLCSQVAAETAALEVTEGSGAGRPALEAWWRFEGMYRRTTFLDLLGRIRAAAPLL